MMKATALALAFLLSSCILSPVAICCEIHFFQKVADLVAEKILQLTDGVTAVVEKTSNRIILGAISRL